MNNNQDISSPRAAFIAEFGDEPTNASADCTDPVAELERFCAELGRELAIAQRDRANYWEANQQLRAALRRIVEIEHHQKPSVTWCDLTLEAIKVAKAALGDKE